MSFTETDNPSAGDFRRSVDRLWMLKELGRILLAAADSYELTNAIDFEGQVDFYAEVQRFEIRLIKRGLQLAVGNQAQAARLLGLKHTTLHGKIKQYGIQPIAFVYEAEEPTSPFIPEEGAH